MMAQPQQVLVDAAAAPSLLVAVPVPHPVAQWKR
jgi:hypothetical protein